MKPLSELLDCASQSVLPARLAAESLVPCTGILIVDDEASQRNVLTTMLRQCGLACHAVSSGREALDLLQREPLDVVIADLNMPDITGMQLLLEIRERFGHLVFLMATGMEDVRLGVEAMRQGADDYLLKPLQLDSVLLSLERAFSKKSMEMELENYRKSLEAMVCERTVQLQNALAQVEQSYAETLDALGAAIDLRDGQTAGHSRRVALYSIQILTRLKATPAEFKTLVTGAWLHDIGKLAIPDAILLKPASLTEKERMIMEGHVVIGYDMVKRIPFLAEAAEIVLTHHERWDGSGYPRRLKGMEIPPGARIFAVSDSLDAMTSNRPYRPALPLRQARKEIERAAGTQFDPDVVSLFSNISDETLHSIHEQSCSMQISAALAGIATAKTRRSAESVLARSEPASEKL